MDRTLKKQQTGYLFWTYYKYSIKKERIKEYLHYPQKFKQIPKHTEVAKCTLESFRSHNYNGNDNM